MRATLVCAFFLSILWAPFSYGTALTAMIGSGERSCYYADVDGAGEKVGAH